MSSKERIIGQALELLKAAPNGIRWAELLKQISAALPGENRNTIQGSIWDLDVKRPDEVFKPARGLWLHSTYRPAQATETKLQTPVTPKIREEQFYEAFADWLVNELEECTKAISVGGNAFKDKWGTPDVIGIREPRKSDIFKFPTEIVSAEVKVDTAGLITAFGQACAYRLFSHKSYIVVPKDSPEDDLARLDTLGGLFGIGLILFNSKAPQQPDFEIRVRAAKHEPDMFYVNRYLKEIEDELFA